MPKRAIKIFAKDNVAVVVERVNAGEEVEAGGKIIIARSEIPPAHKIAIEPIKQGSAIIKYGEVIGYAKEDIEVGDYVHIHNLVPAEE